MDVMALTILRTQAVHWSGKILDTLGVLHVISGNLIDIPGHRLFVAEACSGINSTISSMAFAVGCAAVLRRGLVHLVLLALFGLLFAIVCNILRITAGAVFLQWWEFDLINGWKHETVGLIIFAACVGLILSFDQFLHFLLKPVHDRPALPICNTGFNWPRVTWPVRGFAAAACLATAGGLLFVAPHVTWAAPMWAHGNLPESATFTVPDRIGNWERIKSATELRAETEGVKSEFWTYSQGGGGGGNVRVIIALDFPFPGYHDLAFCYHVQGWTTDTRGTVDDGKGQIELIELSRSAGKATLYFVLFDESGRWLVHTMDESFRGNLWRRLTTLRRPEVDSKPAYQMQALVYRDRPLSPEDREQVQALFREIRFHLARQLAAQLPPDSARKAIP
jgi:exosortase/archaeosortase family protein